MITFHVENADGIRISYRDLDKEAALLWGKSQDDKYYVNPFIGKTEVEEDINRASSWVSVIGSATSSSWEEVIKKLLGVILDAFYGIKGGKYIIVKPSDKTVESIAKYMDYVQPYVDLINLWVFKGYRIRKDL